MEEYINIFGILNKIQKAVAMKKKINKFNYVKITIIILPSSKDIIFKKWSITEWRKVFATQIADKGILSRLFMIRKKTKKSDNQRVKPVRLKRTFHKEETKLLINIR